MFAALYDNGTIIAWHASSGKVSSEIQPQKKAMTKLAKLEDGSLVFLGERGLINVVSHNKGNELKRVLSRKIGKFPYGTEVAVLGGICVSYCDSESSKVWKFTNI